MHLRLSALLATLILSTNASALELCYFTQIDGGSPNCGLRLDGTVYCWGSLSSVPPDPPLPGVFTSVSAGSSHGCGLRSDGSVECWGRVCAPYEYMGQVYYQCTDFTGPNTPPAGQFAQVSAGQTHVCGIRPDGSVECWGGNPGFGGTPPAAVFVQVELGAGHGCGIDENGAVQCWGFNLWGNTNPPPPDTVPPIDLFTDLTNAGNALCALRGGAAECWGDNTEGQTDALAGEFMELSSSVNTMCGLRTDGSVECWGNPDDGRTSPPPGPFVQISGLCGLRADGTAECWGPQAGLVECSVCGNGLLAGDEDCDDGNLDDGDGCDSDCSVTGCGNGIVTSGEECDDADTVNYDGCNNDCTITVPVCGDGIHHTLQGEECDDGNTVTNDGCENDCTLSIAVCGDGVWRYPEFCDDGNSVNDDGCENNCTFSPPNCGNNVLTNDEECDDGNELSGDGCDAGCDQECPLTPSDPGWEYYDTGRSSLALRDDAEDDRDSLKWRWSGIADLYNSGIPEFPQARFELCFYPDDGVRAGAIRLRGDGGWENGYFGGPYFNKYRTNGLHRLQLRPRLENKMDIRVKGKGPNLPDGLLPTASYTIALCETTLRRCWSSSFATGSVDADSFKARSE
jgi:cysteine-rich repeat protein